MKKGVDDSLKTAPKRAPNDDLDLRKRRTGEFAFGETLTLASKALETDPIAMRVPAHTTSPLYSVLERFANIEKTVGIMLATNESEIFTFASSDTPIARLLAEDIPAVANAKKDLDALMRRQESSQGALEKEYKKLERLKSAAEEDTDMEALKSQQVRAVWENGLLRWRGGFDDRPQLQLTILSPQLVLMRADVMRSDRSLRLLSVVRETLTNTLMMEIECSTVGPLL